MTETPQGAAVTELDHDAVQAQRSTEIAAAAERRRLAGYSLVTGERRVSEAPATERVRTDELAAGDVIMHSDGRLTWVKASPMRMEGHPRFELRSLVVKHSHELNVRSVVWSADTFWNRIVTDDEPAPSPRQDALYDFLKAVISGRKLPSLRDGLGALDEVLSELGAPALSKGESIALTERWTGTTRTT